MSTARALPRGIAIVLATVRQDTYRDGGIPMNRVEPHDPVEDYAGALRAIEQDIADLLSLLVEIEVNNGRFIVRGRGLQKALKRRTNPSNTSCTKSGIC